MKYLKYLQNLIRNRKDIYGCTSLYYCLGRYRCSLDLLVEFNIKIKERTFIRLCIVASNSEILQNFHVLFYSIQDALSLGLQN